MVSLEAAESESFIMNTIKTYEFGPESQLSLMLQVSITSFKENYCHGDHTLKQKFLILGHHLPENIYKTVK